jgi:nucleotide-binding universal stress UspA family protein
MFCKDILVAVDASEASVAAVHCAAGLAVDHDAHLTALYLGYDPITAFAESQLPADLLQQHRDRLTRAEDDARSAFEEICRTAGIGSEWRSAWQAQTSVLTLSARYHDLVAMSGTASNDADLIAHRYADSVVIAAGRPVMLFPASYRWDRGLRHIMVAWDGSREATRAVHDAMPYLVRADKVVVMEIIGSNEGERRDPASDIARHLARHGVETEAAHSHETDIALGDQLLDACVDRNVDLLVAGAYGHSRLREYALGGVTRHLMTHLSIPMIFSH